MVVIIWVETVNIEKRKSKNKEKRGGQILKAYTVSSSGKVSDGISLDDEGMVVLGRTKDDKHKNNMFFAIKVEGAKGQKVVNTVGLSTDADGKDSLLCREEDVTDDSRVLLFLNGAPFRCEGEGGKISMLAEKFCFSKGSINIGLGYVQTESGGIYQQFLVVVPLGSEIEAYYLYDETPVYDFWLQITADGFVYKEDKAIRQRRLAQGSVDRGEVNWSSGFLRTFTLNCRGKVTDGISLVYNRIKNGLVTFCDGRGPIIWSGTPEFLFLPVGFSKDAPCLISRVGIVEGNLPVVASAQDAQGELCVNDSLCLVLIHEIDSERGVDHDFPDGLVIDWDNIKDKRFKELRSCASVEGAGVSAGSGLPAAMERFCLAIVPLKWLLFVQDNFHPDWQCVQSFSDFGFSTKPKDHLIPVTIRECSNCKNIDGMHFVCPDPDCYKDICSSCFEVDVKGDGSTVLCPHCEKLAYLPKKL